MSEYVIHVSRRQPSENNRNWRKLWLSKSWASWDDAYDWLASNYMADVRTSTKGDGFHICFRTLEAKTEFILKEF